MAVSSKLHTFATDAAPSTSTVSSPIQFFTEAAPSPSTISAKLISDELSDFTIPGSGGSSATYQANPTVLREAGSSQTYQANPSELREAGSSQTYQVEATQIRGDGSSATYHTAATQLRESGSSATYQANASQVVDTENTVEFGVTADSVKVVIASAGNTIQFDVVAENLDQTVTSGQGLILRGAELHSTTLEGNQGGEIALARKIFTLNTPSVSPLTFVSDNAADVGQVYRIEGVSDFNLTLVDEIVLQGTIPVETLQDFAYIERVTKIDGNALAGTVSISVGALELGTLEAENNPIPETTEILNLLADVPSNPEIEKIIYEKFFLHNDSESQITVTLKEQSDPGDCVLFAIDPTNNGDTFSTSRDLRPVEVPFSEFSSLSKTFVLNPGENRGIWARARLEAGSLVTSKRYQMKICQVIRTLQSGGFGTLNFGQTGFGGSADIIETASEIITLIGRHAGGLGLVQPLSIRNSHPLSGGGNPLRFLELRGAKIVEELSFEPDPVTFRDQFYYNTRINQLFRKIQAVPNPVWKSAR